MALTVQTSARIPKPMLADAYDRWPLTREMSHPQVIRFTFAIALGASEAEALAASRDPRIGTTRKPTTE
jgi:hypothetical protein